MNMRSILAVLIMTSLPACSFQRQAASMALDHNEFAAQTTNRQTVLNVLRAKDREALHFTSFGSISGTVKLAAGGEAGLGRNDRTATRSFNGDDQLTGRTRGAEAFNGNIRATATVTTGTDFTLAVNANDDFYKGIMGPVTQSVIIHFLEQGWPPDLLTYLFVGRMDFYVSVHRKEELCKAATALKSAPPQTPPECTKAGVDFKLLSLSGSGDDSEATAAITDVVRCRRLAVAASAAEPTDVRFGQLDALASISDTSLPKVVDAVRDKTDRYSIDLGKKAPALTMALTLDRTELMAKAQYDKIEGQKLIDEEMQEKCGAARALIRNAFLRTAALSGLYTEEFATLISALRSEPTGKTVDLARKEAVADGSLTYDPDASYEDLKSRAKTKDGEWTEGRGCRPALDLKLRPALAYTKPAIPAMEARQQPPTSGARSEASEGDAGHLLLKNYFSEFSNDDYQLDLKLVLTLRSVEGIIYYLGEYIRKGVGPCVKGETNADQVPILIVHKGQPRDGENAYVEVFHRERHYWVPVTGSTVAGGSGRSSQVINLVQQLLNLHRSAKDLPTVQTVRVAN